MDWTPVLTALVSTLIGLIVAIGSLTPLLRRYIAARLAARTAELEARLTTTETTLGAALERLDQAETTLGGVLGAATLEARNDV
jgi:hypothetical protein